MRNRKSLEIVTVIKLLSPTNKRPGPDRDQYLAKRRGILHIPANLVEFDLLRGWQKMPGDNLPARDYGVMISEREIRPTARYWPIELRQRLPVIPIPLREPALDVRVDLQQLLVGVYDRAGYADDIYEGEPFPPLSEDDRIWSEHVLRNAATRES